MDTTPLSGKNPEISQLRRLLGRRRARVDAGEYVLEGPTLLSDALDAGIVPRTVYVDAGRVLSSPRRELLERAEREGATARWVEAGVITRIADTVTPTPFISVVERAPLSVAALLEDARRSAGTDRGVSVLVLASVSDPGNAGTLMRSAEAAGIDGIIFCSGSVDPFGPKTVRSSAGAVVKIRVAEGGDVPDVLAQLRDAGVRCVGTDASEGTPYGEFDFGEDTAIVLGNEAHGLAPEASAHLDQLITIPMVGSAESLNVAMAGTLLCFEVLRQRGPDWTGAPSNGNLSR